MSDNRLKLNDDKTHLVIVHSKQSRIKSQSANLVQIKTPTKIMQPSHTEKLLGCWIQGDLRWNTYVRDSEENLKNHSAKESQQLRESRNYVISKQGK